MKSTLNPVDYGRPIYNRKSSDQALTTIPRRDSYISGSRIYSVAAQTAMLYARDVENDKMNNMYNYLEQLRQELADGLQAPHKISQMVARANDMRRSEEERRSAALDFVRSMMAQRWMIRFQMDFESKEIITQMVEVGTGEIKMTFPQEQTNEFKRFLKHYPGLFFDQVV